RHRPPGITVVTLRLSHLSVSCLVRYMDGAGHWWPCPSCHCAVLASSNFSPLPLGSSHAGDFGNLGGITRSQKMIPVLMLCPSASRSGACPTPEYRQAGRDTFARSELRVPAEQEAIDAHHTARAFAYRTET